MKVTHSSHWGVQASGIVMVLEEYKILDADLDLGYSSPVSWHMNKKQDTSQNQKKPPGYSQIWIPGSFNSQGKQVCFWLGNDVGNSTSEL